MSITHVYAGDIVKTDTTEDGDLLVYGKATGPDLDLDEQRCDPDWLKNAMPGWAQWANIREQHSAIAAGVGVETVQDGDDWYVKSLVVDAGSAKKVEKGVLKGYSIGIKNARVVKDATAPGGRIVGGEIVEISLVDRPCNPTATMAIAKSADGELVPVDVAGELVMDLSKAVIVDKQPDGAMARPYLKAALETVAPQLRAELEKALAAEAPAFDRDAAVATVAEVLAGTRGPVQLGKAAGGYDESADIAGALAVIKQIAELIRSEAQSLGEGRLEEAWDISCLMDAVRSMSCFLACERAQDSGTSEDMGDGLTYVGLDVEADLFKRVSAEQRREYADSGVAMPNGDFPIPDEDHLRSAVGRLGNYKGDKAAAKKHIKRRASALGLTKLLPDDWEASKAADGATAEKGATIDQTFEKHDSDLVKALAASKERIEALEADLAKAKAQPAAGGPAIMRVAPAPQQAPKTAGPDAAYYMRQADQTQDPKARSGYLQLAKMATAEAEGQ